MLFKRACKKKKALKYVKHGDNYRENIEHENHVIQFFVKYIDYSIWEKLNYKYRFYEKEISAFTVFQEM